MDDPGRTRCAARGRAPAAPAVDPVPAQGRRVRLATQPKMNPVSALPEAGALLSESFERELFRVPSREIDGRYEDLLAEGHRLMGIKAALAGVAANLRLEMRRTFEHDLPPADASMPEHDVRARLRSVTANLRPALQNAILFLGRSLGARLDDGRVFDDLAARRATSERLRSTSGLITS